MSDYLHAGWLALLQGVTEFLPVSSAGHLALAPRLFGWPDQGLAFDVAVHVGTLLAVVVYFRADVGRLAVAWFASITGRPATLHSKLAWALLFATLLISIAGALLESLVAGQLRSVTAVALATMGFGVLLGLADWRGAKNRALDTITWRDITVIACAQVLALIPGASRAGVTISAGLAMGLTREAAARFSFLLAMPVIAAAGVWQARGLFGGDGGGHGDLGAPAWGVLAFATVLSAAVALLCIHCFLGFARRHSLLPFVIYRVALGVILLLAFR